MKFRFFTVARVVLAFLLPLTTIAASALDRPEPASWQASGTPELREQIGSLPSRDYPPLDLAELAAEDEYNQALGEPPRFAVPRETAITPLTAGQWTEIGDTSIWRLRVRAEEAVSLNFGFDPIRLPQDARLYFYTVAAAERGEMDRYEVLGPYTEAINKPHGQFWTPIIQGNDVIIEINVPGNRRAALNFELTRINQGYRAFGKAALGYRQSNTLIGEGKQSANCKQGTGGTRSGDCNMDVACLAEDDPWNDPRRSVGAYSRNGVAACTGSLVNNTAGDRRMLFVSATHCGLTQASSPSIVVYWNYEWPSCRTPGDLEGNEVNPPDPSIINSGGEFLAATSSPFGGNCTAPDECSDVTAVELDDPADPEYDLFWSGWDRRFTPAECGPQGAPGSTDGLCATIHHPGVDEKRITFVERDFIAGDIAGGQGIHWHAFWHPDPPVVENIPEPQPASIPPGVTEPGSSGSPLYTADRRFVGVLSGGPAFCGATGDSLSDFYGQLANAWDGMGTSTTRMRDHLDPLGLNPDFIDGIGMAPFSISLDPSSLAVCAADDQATVMLDIEPDPGFSDPVVLSASGAPTGAGVDFNPATVSPPGTSLFTLSDLASAEAGDWNIEILGASGDDENSRNLALVLNDTSPAPAALLSPVNGAEGVGTQPELSWTDSASLGTTEYRVEVDTSPNFDNPVFSQVVSGSTSLTVTPPLSTSTDYFWRVTASNACGEAETSEVSGFRTAPAPGDCPAGLDTQTLFRDIVDNGEGDWIVQQDDGATSNTWQISDTRALVGEFSWHAEDLPEFSDQRLISPVVVLPGTDQLPISLRFQNWQEIEAADGAACWDASILEISTDDGQTWVQVEDDKLLTQPYDGTVNAFGDPQNPLTGLEAWCGDPVDWTDNVVDLAAWAGEEVRFRFRLGTDTSIGREGWYIDDVRVESCAVVEEVIFADGFESNQGPTRR